MPAVEVGRHQRARIHAAMIEMVVAHGYSAVQIRQLVLSAGVSTRAFYEHFRSKEDCFLRTYEMVMRRVSRRVISSQGGESSWQKRPGLVFAALAAELARDPETARFALIEAGRAGPAALELVQHSESTFAAALRESFARAPRGTVVPPLLIEGMIGGVGEVVRTRLLEGREKELSGLADGLTDWALCYTGESAEALADLDLRSVWRDTLLEPVATVAGRQREEAWRSTGDRGVLLSSTAELFVANGYENLTVTRIRTGAKVSRKVFDTYFENVEDCFVATLEQNANGVLAQAARAQTAGQTWAGGIYRGVAAFCDQVADDPLLVQVCLTNDFGPRSDAAHSRMRLIGAVIEQLSADVPSAQRSSALTAEATNGAIWSLFHHHVIRDRVKRRQLAATLAFVALTPVVGAAAAVTAIHGEQTAK